ncbi:helix-turn-helix transcriptional regulator [Christensenellaceae bacterium NSJ-63]|uniref:Helix-turn-helix transcriptional regulator n=1 Tax=Guopingia tenuis TaxID=2763656 RepID=A0A926HVK8_9FIRM|nr:helix-turn-helix transcriptional regulator [Guopingia tenuis]MBC8537423.1 helix-turn-helix transcriptional regulator [Guopingia tenuis]
MGNKIKECRKKRGVSQEELAKQIGVKRAVISKYETGKISPRLDMVQKIARALGVSIDELLGDTLYIDTLENMADLLISGKATQENLAKKMKEYYPNTPADELLRIEIEAEKERHAQAVVSLRRLPEDQRKAVYTIIEAMSRKE